MFRRNPPPGLPVPLLVRLGFDVTPEAAARRHVLDIADGQPHRFGLDPLLECLRSSYTAQLPEDQVRGKDP